MIFAGTAGRSKPSGPIGPASADASPASNGASGKSVARGPSQSVVMSAPCNLYGTFINTAGVLYVCQDHLEFINTVGGRRT